MPAGTKSKSDFVTKMAPAFEVLINFILDRLYTFFDVNASIVKACIKSGEKDILELTKMIEVLAKISSEPNFRENFSTFKRLANIIKDDDPTNLKTF